MNVKNLNAYFAYLLYGIGGTRVFLLCIGLIKGFNALGAFYSGESVSSFDAGYFPLIIVIAEILACVLCIPMIIINMKRDFQAIGGFFYVFGAMLVEVFICPLPFIGIFAGVCVAFIYLKAGSKILKANNVKDNFWL